MDTIFVRNLILEGRHGWSARERESSRGFRVDMSCEIDATRAALSDDIVDTLDYRKMVRVAEELFAGEPVRLVETLAGRIAERLLSQHGVASSTVTITKPTIFKNGEPGVTVRRVRANAKQGPS